MKQNNDFIQVCLKNIFLWLNQMIFCYSNIHFFEIQTSITGICKF